MTIISFTESSFSVPDILEAFLILLSFEGSKISVLKTYIDEQFKHESRTKGYDYINSLESKGEKKDKCKGSPG